MEDKGMQESFIYSNKSIKSDTMNFQSWIRKVSKEERIEITKQIASTVDKSDDEIEYVNTANLEDMHREERIGIAKKIVSTIPHDWGCASC
jgi:actin-related protein